MTHYIILRDTLMNVSTGRNRHGGGVSLYIINDLTYRIRNDLSMDLINIDILFKVWKTFVIKESSENIN